MLVIKALETLLDRIQELKEARALITISADGLLKT